MGDSSDSSEDTIPPDNSCNEVYTCGSKSGLSNTDLIGKIRKCPSCKNNYKVRGRRHVCGDSTSSSWNNENNSNSLCTLCGVLFIRNHGHICSENLNKICTVVNEENETINIVSSNDVITCEKCQLTFFASEDHICSNPRRDSPNMNDIHSSQASCELESIYLV